MPQFLSFWGIRCSPKKSDYIATDSSVISGIRLIEGTARENAQFIRLKSKNEEISYSPDELSEYGFKNGTTYVSRIIPADSQTKRVFLEKLISGKINLYYYEENGVKTYFLEKDSILTEISKDNFKLDLSTITNDFDWQANQLQLTKYNRRSLSDVVSIYNIGRNKPIEFAKIGVTTGYNSTSLGVPPQMTVNQLSKDQLKGLSLQPSSSVMVGLFADIPLQQNFSFYVNVNISKSRFSANSRSNQTDVTMALNIISADLPIMIRYTLPTLNWRPFLAGGGVYSYHLRSKNEVYKTQISDSTVSINDLSNHSLISDSMPGYCFGVGLQRNLMYRNVLSTEFRFHQYPGYKDSFKKNQLSILFSISF